MWVHFGEVFGGCAVLVNLSGCGVCVLVCRVVVKVHSACVGVLGEDALVELTDLSVLLNILLEVAVVLVHHLRAKLKQLDVGVSHVHKDGRASDNQTNVDFKAVARESIDSRGIEIPLLIYLPLCIVDGITQVFSTHGALLLL